MAPDGRPRGNCVFCGREFTRGGLVTHLKACPGRAEAIAKADAGSGRPQRIFHLQVQDAWAGDYWLHLEMNGAATMWGLDQYLRDIWLECCGHLSAFFLGQAWTGQDIGMERTATAVMRPGTELIHLYDFGTSSETAIRVVDWRRGRPLTGHPIFLMARNDPPDIGCAVCGAPATQICTECMYEEDAPAALCDTHAAAHECDPAYLLPIVNSPRVGMCGYYGPAEPPY